MVSILAQTLFLEMASRLYRLLAVLWLYMATLVTQMEDIRSGRELKIDRLECRQLEVSINPTTKSYAPNL